MSKKFLFLVPKERDKYIVYDEFKDSNGVILSEHDIKPINKIKTSWEGSDFIVSDNKIIPNSNTSISVLDTSIFNATIELDITLGEGELVKAGIVGRYLDSNNYWLIQLNLTDQKVELYEINNSIFILRSTN
jgi:hypothetical protein